MLSQLFPSSYIVLLLGYGQYLCVIVVRESAFKGLTADLIDGQEM